jgi:hypothetical protein
MWAPIRTGPQRRDRRGRGLYSSGESVGFDRAAFRCIAIVVDCTLPPAPAISSNGARTAAAGGAVR